MAGKLGFQLLEVISLSQSQKKIGLESRAWFRIWLLAPRVWALNPKA